jgi:Lon protease-like protein
MPEDSTSRRVSALPVFPLTGSLLLPGTFLPLNVFEQRYLNLVEDSLAGNRLVGMVQPYVPADDNSGPVPGAPERPRLYSVGCVGRIQSWRREADGRFLIVLEGESRFRALAELSLHRGYRRIQAKLLDELDVEQLADEGFDSDAILACALSYCQRFGIELDSDLLAALPGWRLVNALAAALPFRPEEKQLLLEADPRSERARVLVSLMEMAGSVGLDPERRDPAIVN